MRVVTRMSTHTSTGCTHMGKLPCAGEAYRQGELVSEKELFSFYFSPCDCYTENQENSIQIWNPKEDKGIWN